VETHTHSVAELNARILDALADTFPDQVWVQGEIHSYSTSARGHTYFNLVEPGQLGTPSAATVSVVLFGGNRRAVDHLLRKAGGLALAEGLQVRIRGEVTFYPPQGRVQLRMTSIDPRHTLGSLALDRDRLLRTLRDEGLFDRNRSLPLSPVPLRVGLITSDGSAAAHDILHELEHSGHGFRVSLIDTRVQGATAVDDIVAALRTASRLDLDVVALVRGGGARGDLVAFDHEAVARAIASSTVPVITGIGHETDESVADLVAFRSLKTPTACAGFLCDAVGAYRQRCDQLWRTLAVRSIDVLDGHERHVRGVGARVASGARSTLDVGSARLDTMRLSMAREPERVLDRSARHLDTLVTSVGRDVRRSLERADHHLDATERHLGALDPARVLARGWSITRTAQGDLVRSVSDAPAGSRLLTRVADGTISSTVEAQPASSTPSDQPGDPR
jgi:exodeoxyribonuclease VII large subunit